MLDTIKYIASVQNIWFPVCKISWQCMHFVLQIHLDFLQYKSIACTFDLPVVWHFMTSIPAAGLVPACSIQKIRCNAQTPGLIRLCQSRMYLFFDVTIHWMHSSSWSDTLMKMVGKMTCVRHISEPCTLEYAGFLLEGEGEVMPPPLECIPKIINGMYFQTLPFCCPL